MSYVLDSTVLIDYVNGYPPGQAIMERLFGETGDFYVCDVVTCETLSKGRPGELRLVQGMLDALEFVALAPGGARWAGEQRRLLGERGQRAPSTTDALIAALARSLGATVVTRNAKDFEAFDVPVLGYGEVEAG